jgi:23S rRNA (pseudouridine1915-N3)-methyltransferase
MRIALICVGRLKKGPEKDLFDRYCGRLTDIGRKCGIHPLDIRELEESRARRPADRRSDEGRAIESAIPAGAICYLFDERGAALSSDAFAHQLANADQSASALALVIGGPDGLSERCRRSANQMISFGAMTLPHQFVRVLVAEQLYRAATVLTGHPYHRGQI